MNSFEEYLDLLSKNYEEAVEWLLKKYGPAQDDYFRESSYQKFMDGKIKTITRGKVARTSEGLYCHHIDEIKWLKISDQYFVKKYNIPFETQRKNRLVYCDLFEHTILHVLISKETSFEYGNSGYEAYLKPETEEWYLDKRMPTLEWKKKCYIKSFLEPQKAFDLVKEMQKAMGESYFDTLEDYYNEKKKIEDNRNKWIEQYKQKQIDDRANQIKIARLLHHKSPRSEIVTTSYLIRYSYKNLIKSIRFNKSITLKEYDKEMKKYTKEEILDELLLYIEALTQPVEEENNQKK